MSHIPELLAPAGDMLSLKAAVENGADAVYLGVKKLSARAYASNFSLDELEQAIDYAHLRGVKVYVTVNTLIKDAEFSEAAQTLQNVAAYGADAVIVQDVGLISFLREFLPELPVHASTQMTVHNSESVRFLEGLGVKRIVLARELSLEAIRSICNNTQVELEVFIHGALCICYSGQCLFSSMVGGRSGNRGYCAQPCRKQYTLKKNGKEVKLQDNFLLSPKDLNTSQILPLLIENDVSSLKIEGRMKRPEYVAGVVSIYRRLLDRYVADPTEYFVSEEELRMLKQLFNRGFTHAYLSGKPRLELMDHGVPYNRGVLVGTVKGQSRGGYVSLKLSGPLNVGDGVGFSGENTGESVTKILYKGMRVASANKDMIIDIPLSNPVSAGMQVYRTSDVSLLKSMERSFTSQTPVRKVPLRLNLTAITGKQLELYIQDSECNTKKIVSDYVVEPSQKNPTTKEDIEKQLTKLGNTVFSPASVEISSSQDIFIPIKELNNIRNIAVQELENIRTSKWKRKLDLFIFSLSPQHNKKTGKPLLIVNVSNLGSLASAAGESVDVIYYGDENYRRHTKTELGNARDIAFGKGCMIYLSTPSIVWDNELNELQLLIREALEVGFHGVLVSNLGVLRLVQQMACNFIVDHHLNIFNHRSVSFFQNSGAEAVTLSAELTLEQISFLSSYGNVECVIHGNPQLMVMENCIVGSLLGGKGEACSMPCRANDFSIVDEKGFEFPLLMDERCRTHIFNSRELCLLDDVPSFLKAGVRRLRIDARHMDAQKVRAVVAAYKLRIEECISQEAVCGLTCKDISDKYTKGHYFRGVL